MIFNNTFFFHKSIIQKLKDNKMNVNNTVDKLEKHRVQSLFFVVVELLDVTVSVAELVDVRIFVVELLDVTVSVA